MARWMAGRSAHPSTIVVHLVAVPLVVGVCHGLTYHAYSGCGAAVPVLMVPLSRVTPLARLHRQALACSWEAGRRLPPSS